MSASQSDSTVAETETKPKATPYEIIGGDEAVRALVNRFYDIMDSDVDVAPLRAMHAKDLSPMRERLYEFLSGWLGGPPLYFQRPGHACIMSAHRPYAIGEAERDQWMSCMRQALADTDMSDDMRELLDKAFLRMCEAFRNK